MLVSIEEGWDTDDHLEDEDSKGPPVNSIVVTISNEHLWSEVLCSAAERVGKLTLFNELSETEVRHQKIPVFIY